MLALRTRLRRLASRLPPAGSPSWLAAVLLLAALLRWIRIGANSLWSDEAFSWLVARQPAWAILTERIEPILPPLYHFLLHFWIRLGESEAVLRSFSALCGLMTVALMWMLGRALFSPSTGLVAALLVAVLPFHVYFARETRLYALVVFLSALLLWCFIRAWKDGAYGWWAGLGLVAALNLYAHYFAAFTLLVFHLLVLLKRGDRRRRLGLLLSDAVALAVWAPHAPSAWIQTRQVSTGFWLARPSPLEVFKTLAYLLFGHTTPVPRCLSPAALFLTLSVVALVAWAGIRVRAGTRRWVLFLLALVFAPLLIALALSWVMNPVYLDRSFSLVTPAYVLFLAWGLAHPPRGSPVRVLYTGLAVLVAISLGNHYLNPDPAKPPFRQVGAIVRADWREGDVTVHLHDSSYLPLRYYVPEVESYLLDNDPYAWFPAETWAWAGKRVASIDEVVPGHDRLWLVVASADYMPEELAARYGEVLEQATARYACERVGAWYRVDLWCCDLPAGEGP